MAGKSTGGVTHLWVREKMRDWDVWVFDVGDLKARWKCYGKDRIMGKEMGFGIFRISVFIHRVPYLYIFNAIL